VGILRGFDYLHANACPVAQAITGNPNTCSVPLGNGTSVSLSQNSYGWHGTIGENTTSWFGGVLDFSGDYANRIVNFGTNTAPDDVRFNLSAYPFLFGPRFYLRKFHRVSLFGEPLLGGVHTKTNVAGGTTPVSETRWAYALGGGVDFNLTEHFAIRGQADWIRSHFPETSAQDYQNDYRISGGIVFKIRSK
jgi:opacity protein-like surface antigen